MAQPKSSSTREESGMTCMGAGKEWDGALAAEAAVCSRNHRIIGEFGLERTFKRHLFLPPCSEQGHLQPLLSAWIRALVTPGTGEWCPYSNILGKGCLEAAEVETSGFPALGVLGTPSLHSRTPHSSSLENPSPAVTLLPLVLQVPPSDGMWGNDAHP